MCLSFYMRFKLYGYLNPAALNNPAHNKNNQLIDAWIWKIKIKILRYVILVLHFLLYNYSKETYTEPIPGFQNYM